MASSTTDIHTFNVGDRVVWRGQPLYTVVKVMANTLTVEDSMGIQKRAKKSECYVDTAARTTNKAPAKKKKATITTPDFAVDMYVTIPDVSGYEGIWSIIKVNPKTVDVEHTVTGRKVRAYKAMVQMEKTPAKKTPAKKTPAKKAPAKPALPNFAVGEVVEIDGKDADDDYFVVIGYARNMRDGYRVVKMGGDNNRYITNLHASRMHKVDLTDWF